MTNKYYGKVGFVYPSVEVRPGIYKPVIEERSYYGDIINNSQRMQGNDTAYDDLIINNQISILADAYILNNIRGVKYVELLGVLWAVSSAQIKTPRIILTLGGVYNGPQAESAE